MADHSRAMDPEAALRLVDGFSLEMTGKDVPALMAARDVIPRGTRINVTFLGNEDLEMRVAAARAVRELGFIPVPHISARRIRSDQELRDFLDALREVDALESVFAVGGDPAEPVGPYSSAFDLIVSGAFADYGVAEVGIAGYPEGHPDIATDVLWDHLVRKAAALNDQGISPTVLTQFAFDTSPVTRWIEEVRGRGIDATLRIGVPGPAGIKRLLAFARRFGIGANASVVKKYGFSLTNLMGSAGPDRFVSDLAARLTPVSGAVKVHMYAFGGLLATAQWARDYVAAQV